MGWSNLKFFLNQSHLILYAWFCYSHQFFKYPKIPNAAGDVLQVQYNKRGAVHGGWLNCTVMYEIEFQFETWLVLSVTLHNVCHLYQIFIPYSTPIPIPAQFHVCTASFQSSLFVSSYQLWNSLPENVVTLTPAKAALLKLFNYLCGQPVILAFGRY